jgi:two-component system sensor histidine kinase KdpD
MDQNLSLCSLDKGMLDQVIYNLLNNAAIHTEHDCRIDLFATCYADLLEIIIEDNGKGFKNVDPKEVFYKFSRDRNPKTSGSGLGLSIVKGFTEALNGNVVLEKGGINGSRFIISIPVKTTTVKVTENE